MRERYVGSKILSGVYLALIFLVYISIFIYISSDMNSEQSKVHSLILVLITSFIGTYGKQYYESMIYMIYNFEIDRVPKEIKRIILRDFALTNWFTLLLLSSFFVQTLKDHVSIFVLLGVIALPHLLYLIGLFFKLTDSEN